MSSPQEKKTGRGDIDTFFSNLRQLHTEAKLVTSEAETARVLRESIGEAKFAAVAGMPPRVAKVVESALERVPHVYVEELKSSEAVDAVSRADVGITWAQQGVVNQGALVEVVHDDIQKLASCLPAAHIALLSAKTLVPDLSAAMAEVGRTIISSPPGKRPIVSFISGPSKTGDIEMKLLYGVHGPLSLCVLALDWL